MRIVAFSPGLLKAFFYGETIPIRYSTIIKSLSLTIYMQNSYTSFGVLLRR